MRSTVVGGVPLVDSSSPRWLLCNVAHNPPCGIATYVYMAYVSVDSFLLLCPRRLPIATIERANRPAASAGRSFIDSRRHDDCRASHGRVHFAVDRATDACSLPVTGPDSRRPNLLRAGDLTQVGNRPRSKAAYYLLLLIIKKCRHKAAGASPGQVRGERGRL